MIFNLTMHPATQEQIEAGVFDASDERLIEIKAALTFTELPTQEEIEVKALSLAAIALSELYTRVLENRPESEEQLDIESQMLGMEVMIGGAPYLMPYLERALKEYKLNAVYAFSKRESVEVVLDNGDVRKTNIFKHLGFV